jgi:hypothetical protein
MARGDLRAKIRLEGDATGANKAIKSTETRFQKLGKSIKSNAIAITASLAALAGAFRLIKDSAEQAGQLTAFRSGLAAAGISADEFLAKLKEVSDNQIANADLILATNRAIALGIKADDLPALMETAAQASVKLGVSVTQAFNDITTGVGRASPLILDNLGIVVDAVKVYAAFAEELGVSTEALTKQQKTMALTRAVIDDNTDATKKFTDAQDDLTRSINKSAAALKNMQQATGSVLGGLLQMLAGGLTAVAIGFSLVQEAAVKTLRAFVELARLIPGVGSAWQGLSDTLKRWDDEADTAQQKMAKLALELSKGGAATIQLALGMKAVTKEIRLASPALKAVADATEKVTDAADDAGDSMDDLGDSLDDTRDSSYTLRDGMASATKVLQQAGAQAVRTSREFDALADSAGRAAAVAAALQGGGTLSQGGTRIRLQGGGSRLTNVSGRDTRSSYSLSQFGTGGRYTVDPDGTLRPA